MNKNKNKIKDKKDTTTTTASLFEGTVSSATLMDNLIEAEDLSDFLADNRESLAELTFHEYLNNILRQKKMKRADIVRETGFNSAYVYQIFDGEKTPHRDKMIAICLVMGLDIETTQRILKLGGYSELYPRIARDALILFAIHHKWDLNSTDDKLYENKFATLRSID